MLQLEEHLEHIKRIYGYLCKYPDAAIDFRMGIPPNEDNFSMPEYDWMMTVHWEIEGETIIDANLMCCKATGKSAIIHLVNQKPED